MLNSSVKLAQEMAAAEGINGGDSGDESGKEGSPQADRVKTAGGGAMKKKKGAKKKVKKTVFRNNFVKESDSNN